MRVSRFERTFLWILGVGLVLVIGAVWALPESTDWSDSFAADDARPYASAVVRAVLPDLFPDATVQTVEDPPFVHLREAEPTGSAYLFVTDRFGPDAETANRLLEYAARGNTVFVAAHEFSGAWADTLALDTRPRLLSTFDSGPDTSASTGGMSSIGSLPDSVRLGGTGMEQRVSVRGETVSTVFDSIDAPEATVLGTVQVFQTTAPVLVKRSYGNGQVLLSSTPRAFTNVHAVDPETAPYLWTALSHVPVGADPVWWDAYHKPGRTQAETPLRFVLSAPALRNAYVVLLVGGVLFVIVKARRRQRPIPVREPPTNETAHFVTTLGRLAHRRGDADTVARRRVTYLLASIRDRLDVTADPDTTAWTQQVAERAGVDRDTVAALGTTLAAVQASEHVSEAQLEQLDRRIQAFREARSR